MEPWYQIIGSFAPVKQKVFIENFMHQHTSLALEVPIIYFEKKARGEFYIFLAVNSEGPEDKSRLLISLIEQLGHNVGTELDYDKIKGIAAGKMETCNFARSLHYSYPFDEISTDPFDLPNETLFAFMPSETTVHTESFNNLLYWLSATGRGSWDSFHATCKALSLPQAGHVLRRLRLLGHIEVSSDGQHWQVCPPCLVQSGLYTYFLTGQRNGSLLTQIEQQDGVSVTKASQPSEYGPEIIQLTYTNPDVVKDTCRQLKLLEIQSASEHHAEALPELSAFKKLYPVVTIGEPDIYRMERWQDGRFSQVEFRYETGFYRLGHRLARDQPAITLSYDAQDQCWRRGDWYGLRYLAHIAASETSQAIYNTTERCLALPAEQRWPDLYERALVLSSGSLPSRNKDWLYYLNVKQEVALLLATKINATLICKES